MKRLITIRLGNIRLRHYCSFLISIFSALAFTKSEAQSVGTFPLKIMFKNMVDRVPMELHNSYRNPFDEDYSINMFKYYISKITLYTTEGKVIELAESHLINEADSSSKTINLQVNTRKLTSISFMIGVDSIYNVTGTQTGDLDPLNGMFWTWNTGYITAKLEATSTVSTTLNNNASYHIGGFKTGQKTSRIIFIPLPTAKEKLISEIVIEANVNKWFNGAHNLNISDNPACTTPGKLAVLYADNYATMFALASVK